MTSPVVAQETGGVGRVGASKCGEAEPSVATGEGIVPVVNNKTPEKHGTQGDDRNRTGVEFPSSDFREIRLSRRDFSTCVDPDVWVWAHHLRWHAHESDTLTYAAHRTSVGDRQIRVFLHRVILGLAPEDPRLVDHIDGNTLDNRRANLRVVTAAQNAQNQGSRGGSSEHRGVTWDRARGKWMASAMLNGKRTTIGRFATEDEAAAAASAWRAKHMPFSAELAA